MRSGRPGAGAGAPRSHSESARSGPLGVFSAGFSPTRKLAGRLAGLADRRVVVVDGVVLQVALELLVAILLEVLVEPCPIRRLRLDAREPRFEAEDVEARERLRLVSLDVHRQQ